ncbi:MAG: glycosyltransferase [Parachlamydiales bacterium]|jgi:hypothetical protein
MDKIGLIPSAGMYGVLEVFIQQLAEGLRELPGVATAVFSLEKPPKQFFADIEAFKPDCLVVFNSLFAAENGALFCDYLKIPTLFYLVDAPFHFSDPASPYAATACIDRGHTRDLAAKGFTKTLFLPHAVDKADHRTPQKITKYGCVMLSTGINFRERYAKMLGALPPALIQRVQEAFEKYETDALLTLDEALGPEDPFPVPRALLLKEMDLYLKGKKRMEFLQGLKGIQIDLFGGGDGWSEILGNTCPHVRIHPGLDYPAALEVMGDAAVVLSHCSSIKDGAHERLFAAISQGAEAATYTNPYLKENFQKGEGLILGQTIEELGKEIEFALNNPDKRVESILKGQEKIAQAHLWKHRGAILQQSLKSFFGQ